MVDNKSLDFYDLKFFLYKYVPQFRAEEPNGTEKDIKTYQTDTSQKTTPVNDPNAKDNNLEDSSINLARIDRYRFDLTDTLDREDPVQNSSFSKYDISEYVSNYTFNQTLNENTFSWSVSLQNAVIPLNRLNTILKVEGRDLSMRDIRLLAEYEAQGKNLADGFSIHVSKILRGLNELSLQTRNSGTKPSLRVFSKSDRSFLIEDSDVSPGIQLSDLIQPYDMVCMFLYKNDVPVQELRGNLVGEQFVVSNSGKSLVNYTRAETVLRSPLNTVRDATRTIYNNEFNGFVQEKSINTSAGNVDTVNISGDGITRLFGSTRRVIKSGLFQKSLYSILETGNQEVFTAYQNVYADKTIKEIFIDLFSNVYKIKPQNARSVLSKTVILGGNTTLIDPDAEVGDGSFVYDETVAVPTSSFYDISELEVANRLQTNPFSIPPYLLGLVMKRNGFSVRHPTGQTSAQILEESVNDARTNKVSSKSNSGDEKITESDLINTNAFSIALNANPNLQVRTGSRSPIFYSSELDVLQPYFKFFDAILRDFSPEMKTPFEIIDEVKSKTFLEFFERPDGQVYIRAPQYNDVSFNIKSSTLNIINTTYNETIRGLVSRQQVGYSIDALPNIAGIQLFAFTNGKLVSQYGFMETTAESNPNAKNIITKDGEKARKLYSGMTRYAEYLLRLHNAALKSGTIVCGYDPRIVVGRTFYDERNNRFGYITSVSKSVSTGGTATITFNLSYVRDAFFDEETGELQFERLDRLVDLAAPLTNNTLDKNTPDPEDTPPNAGNGNNTTTEVKNINLKPR